MPRITDPELGKQRRKEILEATVRCVIAKGFHAASMKDICREAGISAGGLYRYFGSKDEIILALAEEEQAENQEMIEMLEEGTALLGVLDKMVSLLFQSYRDPDYGRLIVELMAEAGRNEAFLILFQRNEKLLKQALVKALERAQQLGEINKAFTAQEQAEFIMAVLDGFSARILLDPECAPQRHIKTVRHNLRCWLKT